MTDRWRITAAMVGVGVPLVALVAAQPGPAWLWATDACPSSEVACGQPPPAFLLIAGVVLAMTIVASRLVGGDPA